MAWLPEDRRKFLRALDETESRLLVFYEYLLYFLIVAVTVLAFFFYRGVANDAFRDFLRIYGSVLYLIFLAWAVGQLFVIRKRRSRAASGWNPPHRGKGRPNHSVEARNLRVENRHSAALGRQRH